MASGILDRIPNKRDFLGRGMAGLGLVQALERVGRARGSSFQVLIYHRIAEPEGDPYYEPVISATPATFRAQMKMIRDRYRVLRLDELPRDGSPLEAALSEPSVLVTFDDGYRDNAEVAAPILKELGVPATFFLTTDFIEGLRLPWWDHVSYVIKRTTRRGFTLEEGLAVDLGDGSRAARSAAIMTIIAAFLDGRVPDEARFLARLDAKAEVEVDTSRLGRDLFMTWDQAGELATSGGLFSIGSHTVSHRKLGSLDADEQREEIAGSRKILKEMIGCEVDSLAYPYGGVGDFGWRTERVAGEAGYRLGFTAIAGVNRVASFAPLLIPRLMIGSGDSALLLRARLALRSAIGRSFL